MNPGENYFQCLRYRSRKFIVQKMKFDFHSCELFSQKRSIIDVWQEHKLLSASPSKWSNTLNNISYIALAKQGWLILIDSWHFHCTYLYCPGAKPLSNNRWRTTIFNGWNLTYFYSKSQIFAWFLFCGCKSYKLWYFENNDCPRIFSRLYVQITLSYQW